MSAEKFPQQVFIAQDSGIKFNLNYFCMPGGLATDLLVGWVFGRSSGVSRKHRFDPVKQFKLSVETPEAAATENSRLQFRRRFLIVHLLCNANSVEGCKTSKSQK